MHNLDTTTDGHPDAAERPGEARHDDQNELDPGRRELMALHAERASLELRLARAEQERLYLAEPGATAAKAEEAGLLAELDRVMTRIRAAEYRSQPGARTW